MVPNPPDVLKASNSCPSMLITSIPSSDDTILRSPLGITSAALIYSWITQAGDQVNDYHNNAIVSPSYIGSNKSDYSWR